MEVWDLRSRVLIVIVNAGAGFMANLPENSSWASAFFIDHYHHLFFQTNQCILPWPTQAGLCLQAAYNLKQTMEKMNVNKMNVKSSCSWQ